MPESRRVTIDSEKDLKDNATAILRKVCADQRGGLLFLANPVFALEEAGFDLSSAMRKHVLRGLRYGTRTKKRMAELEESIEKTAGHPIDVNANHELERFLFDELKLTRPKPKPPKPAPAPKPGKPARLHLSKMAAEDVRVYLRARNWVPRNRGRWLEPETAPHGLDTAVLEALRERHAVVPKIIELRRLSATGWRFVDRATYEKVKQGAKVTLIRGVRFRHGPKVHKECRPDRG